MPKRFLKNIVEESGPLEITIKSIGAVNTNPRGKRVKRMEFCINATGEDMAEDFLETTFKYDLKGVTSGAVATALMKENGYFGFECNKEGKTRPVVQSASPRANPNMIEVIYDFKLGIAGLVQAYIIQGLEDSLALQKAKSMVKLIRKASVEMAEEEFNSSTSL